MQDSQIYENSLVLNTDGSNISKLSSVFKKVDWAILNDINNGNYVNSELSFDSLNLSNSGRFASYKRAHVTMPVCVVMTSPDVVIKAAAAAEWVVLKGTQGLTMIDTYSLERSSRDVVANVPDINDYLNFRMHETMTNDEVALNSEYYGYYKDTDNTLDATKNPAIANKIKSFKAVANAAEGEKYGRAGESYTYSGDMAGGGSYFRVWHYNLILPLKFLNGFNAPNLDIEKGAHWKLNLKFNSCKVTRTTANVYTSSGTNTCPILVTDTGNTGLKDKACVITCNVGASSIYYETQNGNITPNVNNGARMHVPTYIPQDPSALLTDAIKTLRYDTVISSHASCGKNASFEKTVVTAQSRTKRLIMMIRKGNEYQSSRDCRKLVPGVPSESHYIRNLNVQYGSLNLFSDPVNYTWQNWLDSCAGKYALGSNMDGLAGSQISLSDWKNGSFKVYVFDLTRRHLEDIDVGLSIRVTFENMENEDLACLFFLEVEKVMQIHNSTGVRQD
jgi:hypothetical protein